MCSYSWMCEDCNEKACRIVTDLEVWQRKDITCKRFAVWSRCSYFFQHLDGFQWDMVQLFYLLGSSVRKPETGREVRPPWSLWLWQCKFYTNNCTLYWWPQIKKILRCLTVGVAKTWWWTNQHRNPWTLQFRKLGIKLHLSTQCEVFYPYLVLLVVCSTIVSRCVTSKSQCLGCWGSWDKMSSSRVLYLFTVKVVDTQSERSPNIQIQEKNRLNPKT